MRPPGDHRFHSPTNPRGIDMEDQNPPNFNLPPSEATDATAAAWQDLLAELTELHARLEYLRLLLKMGVRGF